MKTVLTWLTSLLPSFSKKDITEDIKVTRKELNDTGEPIKSAAEFFSNRDFKDADVIKFNESFKRETGFTKFANFIVGFSRMLDQIEINLVTIEKLVDKHFAEDVIKEGMTYTRSNLLRYIEILNFALRYSRHTLLWVYMAETRAVDSHSEIELTKGELEWLTANKSPFFAAFKILMISKDELERTISNIPDIVINPANYDNDKSIAGINKLDPMSMNLIGVKYNVFYHIQEYWVEWQDLRYKASLEERNVLEMRLLNLKAKIAGQHDPRLEQRIQYEEERLQKLKAKILKYEEEANG